MAFRKSPLKQKRDRPRRDEGRVQHGRMRPKASADPTAEQERFHASLPKQCQCGCGRPRQCVHHLLARVPGKGKRRDHWYVVGLANYCHNLGTKSVHLLGSEAAFLRETGVDLVAIAISNLERWRSTAAAAPDRERAEGR